MTAHFEIGSVAAGALLFVLRDGHGDVLLTSRIYRDPGEALSGIGHLRRSAPLATRYLRRRDAGGTQHFVVHDASGEVLAKSEIHSTAWAMEAAIEQVMRHAATATIAASGLTVPAPPPR
ncbi:DUF1508 domain-containing protein [Ideonella sp. A 288]|uniref:YegP family protein n=1 Tax=Ideonella sp. A 288 TaxID=1962181 RepID=UPI0013034755|nr:YegP family protein [Ideonella sp. A 288]